MPSRNLFSTPREVLYCNKASIFFFLYFLWDNILVYCMNGFNISSHYNEIIKRVNLLEKFLDTSIVVRIAPFSFLLALNFFKHSTVSCRWTILATRSLCWKMEIFQLIETPRYNPKNYKIIKTSIFIFLLTQIHGCLRASSERILLAGFTVSIWLIRFLASGVTVSHSGDGYWNQKVYNDIMCFE